jgi:parallel beta-helix repeat protein
MVLRKLWVKFSFKMTGGTIKDNTSSSRGGGVCIDGSTFEMSGGTIKDNTASEDGGGVYLYRINSTFTISGNAVIQGNTARFGGGVYVNSESGATFTKKGNTLIYGDTNTTHTAGSNENTATSGNSYGHAVFLSGGKKRNTTADATVDLYAKYITGSGWSYSDVGGVGDTEGNWE